MKLKIKVPKLGLTIEEVTVSQWEKGVGDKVAAAEVIGAVEADKANYDIVAPMAGTLIEIVTETGDLIEVGGVLAVIDTD